MISVTMTRIKPRVLIVDAHNHLYRAFFGITPLTDPKGRPINAVFGFLRTLLYVIEKYTPSHIAIVFDSRSTRRKRIYSEYKSNRKVFSDSNIVESLFPQIDIAREMTESLGLFTIKVDGYEADDIICDLAARSIDSDLDALIFSRDKDFAQLVDNEDRVKILYPHGNQKGETVLGWAEIREKFGIFPTQIVDFLSLAGDVADNIPGVRGIGEVTAVKLLTKYKTVENIYSHLSELSLGIQKKLINEEDILRISYLLAELKPQLSLETLKGFPESSNFVAFASGAKEYILKLGFQSLLRRI